MIKNWIHEQVDRNIAQFDKAMETHYPESRSYVRDPVAHLSRLCDQCNYLEAVKVVDWQKYLGQGSAVLDLGCGGGWLSGYLSTFDSVRTIYALDSSKHYLSEMMPRVVELMGGRPEKVQPIEGLFSPLLFPDGHLDVVVAASALHHADNLESALKEIRRVVKKDGWLLLLNEAPTSRFGHVYLIAKSTLKTLIRSTLQMYKPVSQAVSSSGFLSNPLLGDREYPTWYWEEALKRSGFELVQHIDSGLPAIKGGRGPSLEHFVCKAC